MFNTYYSAGNYKIKLSEIKTQVKDMEFSYYKVTVTDCRSYAIECECNYKDKESALAKIVSYSMLTEDEYKNY